MAEMVKIKLKNRQARILGLCTGHKLAPAPHPQELEMPQEQLAMLLSDQTFRSWQKLGWVSVVQDNAPSARPLRQLDVPDEPELADALDDVNVEGARALIAATDDLELLSVWHKRDRRKTVKSAIEDRIAALEVTPSEEAEAEAETEPEADPDDVDRLFDGDEDE
jgi:hypothetical protein